jgi:hypothetical protein
MIHRWYIMASRVLNRPARLCLQTHSNNNTKIQITGFHKSTRMICGSGTCQTYMFSGFVEIPWLQSVHHIIFVITYVCMSMPSAKISCKCNRHDNKVACECNLRQVLVQYFFFQLMCMHHDMFFISHCHHQI